MRQRIFISSAVVAVALLAATAALAGTLTTTATVTGTAGVSLSLPLTINGTAAKFFNAALNTGLGKVDVTPTIDVAIPGNTYAGTYTSTVTLAATTGP